MTDTKHSSTGKIVSDDFNKATQEWEQLMGTPEKRNEHYKKSMAEQAVEGYYLKRRQAADLACRREAVNGIEKQGPPRMIDGEFMAWFHKLSDSNPNKKRAQQWIESDRIAQENYRTHLANAKKELQEMENQIKNNK